MNSNTQTQDTSLLQQATRQFVQEAVRSRRQAQELFKEVVRKRRATRQFLPTPVPQELIESVLQDAQHTPSNCNTQPWKVHIVSGPMLQALRAALLKAAAQEQFGPDFSFDMAAFPGSLGERARASGKAHYDLLNIGREDQAKRQDEMRRNFEFFGAPHVALLFMPSIGDSVRTAGDIGMYGQTFLLSLTAHGLAGAPQTSLAFFAPTIRALLGIPDDQKMLFGISFGYADLDAVVNSLDVGRVNVSESVVFHTEANAAARVE